MQKLRVIAATAALVCASGTAFAAHHEGPMDNKAVAKGWFMASCGDLAGFVDYIKAHMAEDGVFVPDRYVGLGFTLNTDKGDDFGTVMNVMPGTPASQVLQKGDRFVSVNGTDMTWENRDKMSFRGMPGEPVDIVMERDGKEMTGKVMRGVIERANDKARVLENLGLANAEEWPADSCLVEEVVAEGNVVYITGVANDTEADTGYTFTNRGVSRLEFNDDGEIVKAWNMDEDRFVGEQLGYQTSR